MDVLILPELLAGMPFDLYALRRCPCRRRAAVLDNGRFDHGAIGFAHDLPKIVHLAVKSWAVQFLFL